MHELCPSAKHRRVDGQYVVALSHLLEPLLERLRPFVVLLSRQLDAGLQLANRDS